MDSSSSSIDEFFDAEENPEQEFSPYNTLKYSSDTPIAILEDEAVTDINPGKIVENSKDSHEKVGIRDECPPNIDLIVPSSERIPFNADRQLSVASKDSVMTDDEVLVSTVFKNLDTGSSMPLKDAMSKDAYGVDPISYELLQRCGAPGSATQLENEEIKIDKKEKESVSFEDITSMTSTKSLGRRLGNVFKKNKSKDSRNPTCMVRNVQKGQGDFRNLSVVQQLVTDDPTENKAVWTMKFSSCGRLLAVAGQDFKVRIWCVAGREDYFNAMKEQQRPQDPKKNKSPPEKMQKSKKRASPVRPPEPYKSKLIGTKSTPFMSDTNIATGSKLRGTNSSGQFCNTLLGEMKEERVPPIFTEKPYMTFTGHTADVLDLSWSKNYFLLSSSLDKTVRLWHISQGECLCCFQHPDLVTSIAFHPKDDRYFISASMDFRLRLWNIPKKKVSVWQEIDPHYGLLTAAAFCRGGKMVVVGTYEGRCLFYNSEDLTYHTQILVKRNGKKRGKKISGIVPVTGEDQILVTSNDSRIRMYDLSDFSLSFKFKGAVHESSQIRANVSQDGCYVICGSENTNFYIWNLKAPKQITRRDVVKNLRRVAESCEAYNAHGEIVTVAMFAPYSTCPGLKSIAEGGAAEGEVLVTADASGIVNVMVVK